MSGLKNLDTLLKDKKAVVFELDDVLYPERDYLLQVYYLFANLLEYNVGYPSANELTDFLKKAYEHPGSTPIFQRASEAFGIDEKYQAAFNKLHVDARLPLKLVLFESIYNLLNTLVRTGKAVFILTRGNPLMQLNKLKQMEWRGLEEQLKVYFYDELVIKGVQDPLAYLLDENQLQATEALLVGAGISPDYNTIKAVVPYLQIEKIL